MGGKDLLLKLLVVTHPGTSNIVSAVEPTIVPHQVTIYILFLLLNHRTQHW